MTEEIKWRSGDDKFYISCKSSKLNSLPYFTEMKDPVRVIEYMGLHLCVHNEGNSLSPDWRVTEMIAGNSGEMIILKKLMR